MYPLRFVSQIVCRNARLIAQPASKRYTLSTRRLFSSTTLARASESTGPDPKLLAALRKTTFVRKLADSPKALEALMNFTKIMHEKGVDLASGKPPSGMQMMRLAANSEFREAASTMVEELKKAGVDLKSKEVMEELMSVKKDFDGGSGSQ
ncbi:hypothetical protein BDQ12DRAFT_674463 [Crucibulum laeve]|uniref:Uncharacterized protein n=1 Tax=Crucibulum laeve TaxID=68775 RepID=A0A5C3MGT8_9AGAR|nr:hypothetical protein BDQ12DRAFT_674463 [Crucibulum laeve]